MTKQAELHKIKEEIPNDLTPSSSPSFTGLTLSGLTAGRLVATNGSKAFASVADLTAWIAGTATRITVSSDGDGTLTITIPDSPSLTGLTLTGATASRLLSTDGSRALASSNLVSWVTGTANRITVADDGDGTITITIPNSPILVGLTLSGLAADSFIKTSSASSIETFGFVTHNDDIVLHDDEVVII